MLLAVGSPCSQAPRDRLRRRGVRRCQRRALAHDERESPWEGGKYVFTLVLLIVLARFVRPLRHSFAPLLYLFVLLPSCAIAVWQLGPSLARGELASTLAGPMALGVAALAFRQFIVTETEARQLLWAVVGPAVAVAAIATKATLEAGTITFTGESNFVTSGGYGPNQVSNILGAGAVCCLLVALSRTPVRCPCPRP